MEKLTETVKQTGLDYEDPMAIFWLDLIERGVQQGREEERARTQELEGLLKKERARTEELLTQERNRAERAENQAEERLKQPFANS